jgi:hypothetical protein
MQTSRRFRARLAPLLVVVFGMVAAAPAARAQASGEVLTNASVIEMVTGKLQKSLIIAKIQGTRSAFDITADGLISLTQNKVSQDIVKAMMLAYSSNAANRPAGPPEVLTNEIVVRLIVAKVHKSLVLDKIRDTKGAYDVTTSGLVNLNQNKVPQDVIKAIMTAAGS